MTFHRNVARMTAAALLMLTGVCSAEGEALETSSADASATLPVVNMEAAVKAAQIDPQRADDTRTPGAKSSVLRVERALLAEGLLDRRWVDGYFGTATTAAYREFQTSMGFSGLAANGLPGRRSLNELGTDRFVVSRVLDPGARVDAGKSMVINTRTQSMLAEAERRLGWELELEQGSYNRGGDPTSAGTHDGGGVVDISVDSMDRKARSRTVRQLRRVGFAAWLRQPTQGNWPRHIHAVAISDTDLSRQAQNQVGDYYLGLNGLANNAPDDGPRVQKRTWEEYQRRQ